jgi:cation:H+ antiporter
MAPGVRGATINAIGSSMPELMTAFFLLFLYHDRDGFAAGIATTAGSAIFNAIIIPALCILAVRYKGVVRAGTAVREKIKEIEISKRSVLRDGFFLLLAEGLLIILLGNKTFVWWMGGLLIGVYGLYFLFLMRGFGGDAEDDDGDDDNDDDGDDDESPSTLRALITFDFNNLLFNGKRYTTSSAWVVLSLATAVIGVACWQLAEAVMMSSSALGVPAYFTALVLAAAATSAPDTVLSVKDALRGDYDDAVSNALGSNTFDITVALGLPLIVYALLFGDITVQSAAETQDLRIILFAVTAFVLVAFLIGRRITIIYAYMFLTVYAAWLGYIIWDVLNTPGVAFG